MYIDIHVSSYNNNNNIYNIKILLIIIIIWRKRRIHDILQQIDTKKWKVKLVTKKKKFVNWRSKYIRNWTSINECPLWMCFLSKKNINARLQLDS